MIVFPNAKINIGLNIVEKRADGYHNLQTIFYPVKELFDALEFFPNNKQEDNFVLKGIKLPSDGKKNLVLRALDIVRENYQIPFLDIILQKNIPSGAGLGGGSSDAGFFIKALNEYFKLNISIIEMEKMASRLGADCAFFIKNTPQYAIEKGDKFFDANFLDKDLIIKIFKPEFGISTPEAYKGVKAQEAKSDLKLDFTKSIYTFKDTIKNDFEQFLFPRYPELQKIKNLIYQNGAIYASMTGSGSAFFGIWDKVPNISNDLAQYLV